MKKILFIILLAFICVSKTENSSEKIFLALLENYWAAKTNNNQLDAINALKEMQKYLENNINQTISGYKELSATPFVWSIIWPISETQHHTKTPKDLKKDLNFEKFLEELDSNQELQKVTELILSMGADVDIIPNAATLIRIPRYPRNQNTPHIFRMETLIDFENYSNFRSLLEEAKNIQNQLNKVIQNQVDLKAQESKFIKDIIEDFNINSWQFNMIANFVINKFKSDNQNTRLKTILKAIIRRLAFEFEKIQLYKKTPYDLAKIIFFSNLNEPLLKNLLSLEIDGKLFDTLFDESVNKIIAELTGKNIINQIIKSI